MKSRLLKSVYILLAIVAVIDWPVEIEAQGGAKVAKTLGKAIKSEEGLLKSCSHSEEAVNKASHESGQMNMHPAAVGGAVKAARNLNSSSGSYDNSNNYSTPATSTQTWTTCGLCNGVGYINGFCDRCDEGSVYCSYCSGNGCDYCNGYGVLNCGYCNGTGDKRELCNWCKGKGGYYSNN